MTDLHAGHPANVTQNGSGAITMSVGPRRQILDHCLFRKQVGRFPVLRTDSDGRLAGIPPARPHQAAVTAVALPADRTETSLMIRGIRKLIQHNGRVQRGERAVVVTNPEMRAIADLLVSELHAHGADVTLYVVPKRLHDGQEPPEDAAAAMLTASVIFSPVAVSITHTRAMRAVSAGVSAADWAGRRTEPSKSVRKSPGRKSMMMTPVSLTSYMRLSLSAERPALIAL